jgi:putative addiction module component (TIGR02574 family)
MTVETIFEQAMTLTEDEREALVRRLLPTLPADEPTDPDALAAAWHQEIVDRLDRFDRGETSAVPADQVFARLEKRFGGIRG